MGGLNGCARGRVRRCTHLACKQCTLAGAGLSGPTAKAVCLKGTGHPTNPPSSSCTDVMLSMQGKGPTNDQRLRSHLEFAPHLALLTSHTVHDVCDVVESDLRGTQVHARIMVASSFADSEVHIKVLSVDRTCSVRLDWQTRMGCRWWRVQAVDSTAGACETSMQLSLPCCTQPARLHHVVLWLRGAVVLWLREHLPSQLGCMQQGRGEPTGSTQ